MPTSRPARRSPRTCRTERWPSAAAGKRTSQAGWRSARARRRRSRGVARLQSTANQAGKGLNNMCGIVGYIGEKQVVPVLVEGLRKLEYRGYDSAGVAVVRTEGIEVRRSAGKL